MVFFRANSFFLYDKNTCERFYSRLDGDLWQFALEIWSIWAYNRDRKIPENRAFRSPNAAYFRDRGGFGWYLSADWQFPARDRDHLTLHLAVSSSNLELWT